MTVNELFEKIAQNCPPNCIDKLFVVDPATGAQVPIQQARYRHDTHNNRMVMELVVDSPKGVPA